MQESLSLNAQQETNQYRLFWKRTGLLGWWLNLTAPPRPENLSTLQAREYVRRSELISLVIVAMFGYFLGIISPTLTQPSVAGAVLGATLALSIALALNRLGKIRIAAYIVVCSFILAAMGSILGLKGGYTLIWLQGFDLFSIPIFISALVIHRRASLFFAVICAAFTLLYYIYAPHALINGNGAHNFDDVNNAISLLSWWAVINRPVFLCLFAGLFGWLAALSFESALEWGEQARNEAAIARGVATYKDMAEKALGQFVQEITQAFAALDNGTLRPLQNRAPSDPLHNIVIFLNDQFKKMASLRIRHLNNSELTGMRGALEAFYQEVNQAFTALNDGRLHLLQERSTGDPLGSLITLLNTQLKRLASLRSQLGNSLELTEMRRLIEVINRIKSRTTPMKYLDPGPGRFSSSCKEVNYLAKELYESTASLQSLRQSSNTLWERSPSPRPPV